VIPNINPFLEETGIGRSVVNLQKNQVFYTQGDPAVSIFYLRTGRARLTVVSPEGKEATVAIFTAGEFIGEAALSNMHPQHLTTATAMFACTALEIKRDVMLRAIREEPSLSDMYLNFLLIRSMRTQADLIDQLFNSSEKRLARILLLMADFDKPGEPSPLLPPITQETLAEMIGTTRSRVSFFMNRFRKLGLIDYKDRVRVHKSLINVLLHDQFTQSTKRFLEVSPAALHLTKPYMSAR
jgi:CRP-like cAMP-binding protein